MFHNSNVSFMSFILSNGRGISINRQNIMKSSNQQGKKKRKYAKYGKEFGENRNSNNEEFKICKN